MRAASKAASGKRRTSGKRERKSSIDNHILGRLDLRPRPFLTLRIKWGFAGAGGFSLRLSRSSPAVEQGGGGNMFQNHFRKALTRLFEVFQPLISRFVNIDVGACHTCILHAALQDASFGFEVGGIVHERPESRPRFRVDSRRAWGQSGA